MSSSPSRGGESRPKKAADGKSRSASKPKRQAPKRKPRPLKTSLTWEGITMAITYEPESFGGQAHLQVRVTAPVDAPLPITETGYRSHFLPRAHVEFVGGPAAFVRAWLEEAARSPSWRRTRDRWRQLELF
jgi:hypothetical protein